MQQGVAGLSLEGEGPEKTVLSLGFLKSGGGNSIEYSGDATHDDVTWRNLTYDGRLDDFSFDASSGTVHWGLRLKGDGEYTFENVRFRNWAGNAIWNKSDSDLTFDHCTWENIGIKNLNDHDGESVGHGIAVNIYGGQSVTVTNSEFHLVSGKAMDFNGNGTARVSNCWASGLGSGMFKVNNWDTIDISNVYAEADTPEYKDALTTVAYTESPDSTFLHRLDGDRNVIPTIVVNDIEGHQLEASAFSANRGYNLQVNGGDQGPIAFHDIVTGTIIDSGLRTANDASLNLDIGKLSLNNVGGKIFDLAGSDGRIEEFSWSDARGFGTLGDVELVEKHRHGKSYSPTVPSRDEVGVATGEYSRN